MAKIGQAVKMGFSHLTDTMGDGIKVFSSEVTKLQSNIKPEFMKNLKRQKEQMAKMKTATAEDAKCDFAAFGNVKNNLIDKREKVFAGLMEVKDPYIMKTLNLTYYMSKDESLNMFYMSQKN